METNIDFTEYDRITDTLMYLNDDVTLNFTVALSRKSKNGDRLFYHYESIYGSDKYGGSLRSIKRSMSFYFVLDVKSNFNHGFILRPQDVEILNRLITSKVLPWYFGNEKEAAFQIIGDKLVLTDFQPAVYTQATQFETKYLSFEPIVVIENEQECRGVRLIMSSGHIIELTIDKFMGFYHLLHTDMYSVASTMTTYAKVPPYAVNSHKLQGLGAPPPSSMNGWNGFNNSNSFLNNSKSKREGE